MARILLCAAALLSASLTAGEVDTLKGAFAKHFAIGTAIPDANLKDDVAANGVM